MLTEEEAVKFAEDWVSAWNSHDLDKIMAHYADDVELVRLRQNPIPRRTYRSERQATAWSHCPQDQNRLVRGPEAARRDSSDQNQTGKRGATDHQKIPDRRWQKHGGCFHRKPQRRTTDHLCPPNLAQVSLSNRAHCRASGRNLRGPCHKEKSPPRAQAFCDVGRAGSPGLAVESRGKECAK